MRFTLRLSPFYKNYIANSANQMIAPVRVQLRRTKGFRLQEYSRALNGLPAVKVDRTTIFGNPFPVKHFGLEQSLALFETWFDLADVDIRNGYPNDVASRLIMKRFMIMENLPRLRGHNIACWCDLPEPYGRDRCHGATLLKMANRPPRRVQILRRRGWKMPPNTWPVNKGIWANPYEEAPADLRVALFRDHLKDPDSRRAAILRRRLHELRGYDVACTCDLSEPCHGDVLLELANQPTV